jgi:hypothetical protein
MHRSYVLKLISFLSSFHSFTVSHDADDLIGASWLKNSIQVQMQIPGTLIR